MPLASISRWHARTRLYLGPDAKRPPQGDQGRPFALPLNLSGRCFGRPEVGGLNTRRLDCYLSLLLEQTSSVSNLRSHRALASCWDTTYLLVQGCRYSRRVPSNTWPYMLPEPMGS